MYLRFDDSRIIESEEVRSGFVLDFNERNEVVGIEILGLKARGVPSTSLKEMIFKVGP